MEAEMPLHEPELSFVYRDPSHLQLYELLVRMALG